MCYLHCTGLRGLACGELCQESCLTQHPYFGRNFPVLLLWICSLQLPTHGARHATSLSSLAGVCPSWDGRLADCSKREFATTPQLVQLSLQRCLIGCLQRHPNASGKNGEQSTLQFGLDACLQTESQPEALDGGSLLLWRASPKRSTPSGTVSAEFACRWCYAVFLRPCCGVFGDRNFAVQPGSFLSLIYFKGFSSSVRSSASVIWLWTLRTLARSPGVLGKPKRNAPGDQGSGATQPLYECTSQRSRKLAGHRTSFGVPLKNVVYERRNPRCSLLQMHRGKHEYRPDLGHGSGVNRVPRRCTTAPWQTARTCGARTGSQAPTHSPPLTAASCCEHTCTQRWEHTCTRGGAEFNLRNGLSTQTGQSLQPWSLCTPSCPHCGWRISFVDFRVQTIERVPGSIGLPAFQYGNMQYPSRKPCDACPSMGKTGSNFSTTSRRSVCGNLNNRNISITISPQDHQLQSSKCGRFHTLVSAMRFDHLKLDACWKPGFGTQCRPPLGLSYCAFSLATVLLSGCSPSAAEIGRASCRERVFVGV